MRQWLIVEKVNGEQDKYEDSLYQTQLDTFGNLIVTAIDTKKVARMYNKNRWSEVYKKAI